MEVGYKWFRATSKTLDQTRAKIESISNEPEVVYLVSAINHSDPSVAIAFGLGAVFMLGVTMGLLSGLNDFGFYLAALTAFHFLEHQYVNVFHRKECNHTSFLLSQSKEAQYAVCAAFLEYFIELFFFPFLKGNWFILYPAFIVVILAQAIRTTAMWTAKSNFHHHIREVRDEKQVLVTHGIYSISRHPAYFGWFWWSIFTQVLLFNPICIVVYAYLSWEFFTDRIKDEESTLVRDFKDDYTKYKQRVPVGIPFIH